MKIRKVAVGNAAEAFIEGNFTNGVNIISSDDNNKGKTIVIQRRRKDPYAYVNDTLPFNRQPGWAIWKIQL